MATDDLEKFVQKNSKKEKPVQHQMDMHQHAAQNPDSFGMVFKWLNGERLLIFFVLALIIFSVGIFRMLTSKYQFGYQEAMLGIMIFVFIASDLFILYFILHFIFYKKFLSGNAYPFTGWRELVNNRSVNFWKGKTYLMVSLKVELSASASSTHHQAVSIFLQKFIERWGSGHSGNWKKGSPKNFELTANEVMGHINLYNGTTFFLRELIFRLPAFVKLLGTGLKNISISTQGERSFAEEIDEDPYQQERDRKWMDQN